MASSQNSQKALYLFSTTLLLVILLGVSWGSSIYKAWSPPICAQLIESGKTLVGEFSQLSPETASQWITEKIGISDHLIYTLSNSERVGFQWRADDVLYTATFKQEQFFMIELNWFFPDMTIKKMINCFGNPGYYTAYTIGKESSWRFVYYFWYPEQGLIARYGEDNTNKYAPIPTTIEPDFPVAIVFTFPTTITDISENYDLYFLVDRELFSETLLQPWPGSLSNVKIVHFPINR